MPRGVTCQVKVPEAKPDDLSLTLRTHMVEDLYIQSCYKHHHPTYSHTEFFFQKSIYYMFLLI